MNMLNTFFFIWKKKYVSKTQSELKRLGMIISFVSYAHKWKHWHAKRVYSFQLPQMNHVDLHQKQDDAKLSNPCIISMPVTTCVNRSIMVAVVAMPTNLKLKVYVHMSAKNTVGRTTLFSAESLGNWAVFVFQILLNKKVYNHLRFTVIFIYMTLFWKKTLVAN